MRALPFRCENTNFVEKLTKLDSLSLSLSLAQVTLYTLIVCKKFFTIKISRLVRGVKFFIFSSRIM